MRNIAIIYFILIFIQLCFADICSEWNTLETLIRDCKINKQEAKKRIIVLHKKLKSTYHYIKKSSYIFPVKKYKPKDIGGKNGNGFIIGRYNFYDGNTHTGHPAQDIFIFDKNYDCLTDSTNEKVKILSFTSGVVVAVNINWNKNSTIRGGKYIWIFSPALNKYFYYAHLKEIVVKTGDIVHAGQYIGVLGRTGKNAIKHRSPTHLHFMCLDFSSGKMLPYNTYINLIHASSIKANNTLLHYSWTKNIIGKTIKDIPCPNGYKRITLEKGTFAHWLRHLPLKASGTPVYLYNGELKNNQNVHHNIIDIDIGNRDLQQCADAIMRLRAEYLYAHNLYDKIHFNFVNGFNADYLKWCSGNDIKVTGNNCYWIKSKSKKTGYNKFRKYMNIIFSYANTYSLKKEMKPVKNIFDIHIGDIFIEGGFPGHAVIVVDLAQSAEGDIVFMLAQSYMPAQDIHVLKSMEKHSPWYSITFGKKLITPEWTFDISDLRRFIN